MLSQRLRRLRTERPHDGIEFACSEPAVDLRNQRGQFNPVSLAEASEHIEFAGSAIALALSGRKNRVHGFFLGVADETAGIHQQEVRVFGGIFRQHAILHFRKLGQKMLGIDGVFAAPQGDNLNGLYGH